MCGSSWRLMVATMASLDITPECARAVLDMMREEAADTTPHYPRPGELDMAALMREAWNGVVARLEVATGDDDIDTDDLLPSKIVEAAKRRGVRS